MKKWNLYRKTMFPLMDKTIVFTSILCLLSNSCYTLFVIGISVLLQGVTDKRSLGSLKEIVVLLALGMVVFLLFKAFVSKKLAKNNYRTGKRIRKALIESMLGADLLTLQGQGHGRISEIVEQDIKNAAKSFPENFLPIVSGVIQFAIILLYGLTHSPFMVAAILALTVISIFLPKLFSEKIYKGYEEITKMQERSREGIKKTISALQDVHTERENHFIEALAEKDFCTLKEKQYEYEKEVILLDVLSAGIGLFTTILWIGLGVWFIHKGLMSVSVLFAFMNLSDEINWPFISLPYLIAEFNNALVSIEKIKRQIQTLQASHQDGKIKHLEGGEEKIQYAVKNMSFSYENTEVLSDITMEITFPGKRLLDGDSGCGKSTFVKLLCGFYQPKAGELSLLIGKQKVSGEKLTESVSYVEQSSVILNGTLEDNILFGDGWKQADSAEKKKTLEEAIRKAELQDFYESLNEGKDTILGSGGRELSFGERQRISIARALAKPHSILLLDEPTAHLDEVTEYKILQNILDSEENVIMVTHRACVKEKFDKKIVFPV